MGVCFLRCCQSLPSRASVAGWQSRALIEEAGGSEQPRARAREREREREREGEREGSLSSLLFHKLACQSLRPGMWSGSEKHHFQTHLHSSQVSRSVKAAAHKARAACMLNQGPVAAQTPR